MGILAIAIVCGTCAAVAALIAGQSFLTVLAIYSGCGILSVGILVVAYMISETTRARKDATRLHPDVAV